MSYTTDNIEYTATGGETTLTDSRMIDTTLVKLTREIRPLTSDEYTFDAQLGKITFSEAMIEGENAFIIYTTKNE